jgi:hypothetical protein
VCGTEHDPSVYSTVLPGTSRTEFLLTLLLVLSGKMVFFVSLILYSDWVAVFSVTHVKLYYVHRSICFIFMNYFSFCSSSGPTVLHMRSRILPSFERGFVRVLMDTVNYVSFRLLEGE